MNEISLTMTTQDFVRWFDPLTKTQLIYVQSTDYAESGYSSFVSLFAAHFLCRLQALNAFSWLLACIFW